MGDFSGRLATRDTVHACGAAGGRPLCCAAATHRQQQVQSHFETSQVRTIIYIACALQTRTLLGHNMDDSQHSSHILIDLCIAVKHVTALTSQCRQYSEQSRQQGSPRIVSSALGLLLELLHGIVCGKCWNGLKPVQRTQTLALLTNMQHPPSQCFSQQVHLRQ